MNATNHVSEIEADPGVITTTTPVAAAGRRSLGIKLAGSLLSVQVLMQVLLDFQPACLIILAVHADAVGAGLGQGAAASRGDAPRSSVCPRRTCLCT